MSQGGREPSGRAVWSKRTAEAVVPSLEAGLAPGLYLVATPIGNLRDITLRALDTLSAADVLACEDTRTTAKLTRAYGIGTPRIAYHEHNEAAMSPRLVARVAAGEAVALVSDAGTPLVSDPGHRLVAATLEAGLPVFAIPGPSAVLTALIASGLGCESFHYRGFLPAKAGARERAISALAQVPGTLVLFESPRRLAATLAALAAGLGERPAAVARELTKLHEEIRRGSLGALAEHYGQAGPPKGEVVIVVGAAPEEAAAVGDEALAGALGRAMATGSLADAVRQVAEELGLPRRRVYQRALELERNGARESAGRDDWGG